MPPPINFEASQLKQEGLFWFNLHTNLVTWVPTFTKIFSKSQRCLSYASCDEMIKNSPCKVGLKMLLIIRFRNANVCLMLQAFMFE